jgi:hypothetical protein
MAGSKTVMATTGARLFTRTDPRNDSLLVYACLYARNRRFLLSTADASPGGSGDATRLPALAGRYVAYVRSHFDDAERYNPQFRGFPDEVVALDLSTGARRRSPAATGGSPSAKATDLVLSSTGSFAWIGSGPAGNEVHRLNAGEAADTVVDSGSDVQAGSLALAGSTLYWTKAGRPVSAPIG